MEPGRVTSLLSKLRGAALEEMFGTPMHAAFIGGPTPDKLAFYARDPLSGDSARGEALLDGQWRFGPEKLDLSSPRANDPWTVAAPSRRFARSLHGFSWLRDLSAVGAPGAAAARRPSIPGSKPTAATITSPGASPSWPNASCPGRGAASRCLRTTTPIGAIAPSIPS